MIEADRVIHSGGKPEIIDTPSNSGKGQKIARCPKCRIAVWSNYASAGPVIRFVRVGTLDSQITCHRTYTSLPLSNSRGLKFPRTFHRCRNITNVNRIGRPRVSPGAWRYYPGSRPIRGRFATANANPNLELAVASIGS
jgi:hypothetical protein